MNCILSNLSGVYCIKNSTNSHQYIGSSKYLKNRHADHFSKLRNGVHCNKYLQRAFDKYGEDCFNFVILEYTEAVNLVTREQWYLDNLKPEYNINKKAYSCLGRGNSPETRRKISEANKGKIVSQATRQKKSQSLLGHFVSNETKEKISAKAKQRLSGNPQNHPMFGKTHSEDSRLLIKRKRQFQDMSHLCKSIKQLNKQTGEVIKIWDSIKSASKTLNIGGGNISSACNKNSNLKSAGGFRWEYANEPALL